MRIESKHLFSESISPLVKSIILKKRAGIKLTERETRRLELESRRLNEVVSMVQIPTGGDRLSPTQSLKNTFDSKKPFEELEDDEEIDLDEILREMGYGEDKEEVYDLDELLREMGYSDELDEKEEEEIEYLSDEDYERIMKELGIE
jgi:hypothetical protein